MKVLVVDDSESVKLLLNHYLCQYGYDALFASNGTEGLDMARIHKPDLIISDILMPVMDGFGFLKALRGDADIMHIPFIFFSGSDTDEETINLTNSLGADGCVEKTNDFKYFSENLANILKEIADRKGQTRKKP
jgi:CheY-like chemotaxis protein